MVYFVPDFVIEGVGYNALNKSRKDLLTIYQKLAFVPIVNTQMVLDDKEVKYFARNSKVLGGFVHEVLEAIEQKCKDRKSTRLNTSHIQKNQVCRLPLEKS